MFPDTSSSGGSTDVPFKHRFLKMSEYIVELVSLLNKCKKKSFVKIIRVTLEIPGFLNKVHVSPVVRARKRGNHKRKPKCPAPLIEPPMI